MRVISGSARGTALISPEGREVRPTLDRVKEAVFSMLGADISEKNVLDLFSGSGALGIEALSRGAKAAVFVDMSRSSLDITRQNLHKTRLEDRALCVLNDFSAFLKENKQSFELVFLDPPYREGLLGAALASLYETDALSDNAVVVCETDDKIPFPLPVVGYELIRDRRYGRCRIFVLTKKR